MNNYLNYKIFGRGTPILLLHGWGGSSLSMIPIAEILSKKGFKAITLDLPGFGNTTLHKEKLDLDGYALAVEKLINMLDLKDLILFGHSFGGSLSIKLAIRKKIDIQKMILCNSSGIRKRTLKKFIFKNLSKSLKFIFKLGLVNEDKAKRFFYYYIIRERDYIQAEELKETFKNIVKEDLSEELNNVRIPTLILWGEEDTETTLKQGKFMHLEIINSKFKVFEKEGHNLPIKSPLKVASEIQLFAKN